MIRINNCRLVPELTEGYRGKTADVIVEGDRISKILKPGTEYPVHGRVKTINAEGKTLLPGFIDMHLHLFMGKKDPWKLEDRIAVPSQRAIDALAYAQFLLGLGFTTIRDVGDSRSYAAIAARNAINEGYYTGPRIICSGLTLSSPMPGAELFEFMTRNVSTADEMRIAVREQFIAGADMIKLYGTGSMMVDDSRPGRRILTVDEVRAAVEITDMRGSYCACHCHGTEAIGVMIDNGVHTIEHSTFIDDASCKKLDGNRDQGIVLTLSCTDETITRLDGYTEDRIVNVFGPRNAERNRCLKNAYENYDILMGFGTDLSLDSHSKAPFEEWKSRKNALGMKNIDILKQATVNGAKLLGLESEIGTVKEGKCADLVLLDGDPVSDFNAICKKPAAVIKSGKLVK